LTLSLGGATAMTNNSSMSNGMAASAAAPPSSPATPLLSPVEDSPDAANPVTVTHFSWGDRGQVEKVKLQNGETTTNPFNPFTPVDPTTPTSPLNTTNPFLPPNSPQEKKANPFNPFTNGVHVEEAAPRSPEVPPKSPLVKQPEENFTTEISVSPVKVGAVYIWL
jgi:hypothetical protein